MMRVKRLAKLSAIAAFLIGAVAGRANATTILLDMEDPIAQNNTPIELSFIASDPFTTIEFAGYQVPAFEHVTNIRLQEDGLGPNVLGAAWTFIPAPMGSLAFQFNDGHGTNTNGLTFGGVVEDSFDRFDQTIATIPSELYTLRFQFSNDSANRPSELIASTSANAPTVPEPATLTLTALGLGTVVRRYRRRGTTR